MKRFLSRNKNSLIYNCHFDNCFLMNVTHKASTCPKKFVEILSSQGINTPLNTQLNTQWREHAMASIRLRRLDMLLNCGN